MHLVPSFLLGRPPPLIHNITLALRLTPHPHRPLQHPTNSIHSLLPKIKPQISIYKPHISKNHSTKNSEHSASDVLKFVSPSHSFSLFPLQKQVLEQWEVQLSKKINKIGFHSRFRPLRKLGRGTFATVFQVQNKVNMHRFAAKAFLKESFQKTVILQDGLLNEIQILRKLSEQNHKNIQNIIEVYESDNTIYMVVELYEGGHLLNRLRCQNRILTEKQIRLIMNGLMGGLESLHHRNIVHRDIKLDNLMLRKRGTLELVICDFGLATEVDADKYLYTKCGTPGFVAPEIFNLGDNDKITTACDIFSAGVVFHTLLTGTALFEATTTKEVYRKNEQMDFDLTSEKYDCLSEAALDLLDRMLRKDPATRISAKDACKHPFLSGQQSMKHYSPTPTRISFPQSILALECSHLDLQPIRERKLRKSSGR